MADLFDNPMGLMGFEFVEFASPQAGLLEPIFERMGFTLVAKHRSKDVVLFRQGDINFIVNRASPHPIGRRAARLHGDPQRSSPAVGRDAVRPRARAGGRRRRHRRTIQSR